ncbi:MAG: murein biosynthesis integral membrane protein MurJ [Patescibacteria group bacterium]
MLKILDAKFNSLTSAAFVIAALGIISRLLGLARDRILAGQFGAGDELDVYYAAFRLPDFIYNIVILGALSAGFIPIFVGLLRNEEGKKYGDNEKAWDLLNNLLNIFALFLLIACLFLAVISPWLVPLITPGFASEKMQLTIKLTRLMFLSPVFLGLSGLFGGVLQSFKRFFLFSLAPVLYNVGIIIGALFLTKYFGIYGLALGVAFGAALHLLVQIPSVFRLGFVYKFIFNLKDIEFLKIIKMMVPRILGLASGQLNLIIVTFFASALAAGSLAIFNLSNNLQSFPIGIFGGSFALAVFPALAKSFSDNNEADFKDIFHKTFKQILFFVIPFSILLIILRAQIIRVVLGSGRFNWEDTILTANSLGIFCFSLFAQALLPLLARAFYARHDTVTPFITSFIGMLVNAVLSWIFVKQFGVLGLALGFSISMIVYFILLFVLLKVKVKGIGSDGILMALFKVSIASLVMGAIVQFMKTFMAGFVDMQTFSGILTQGAVAAFAGVIAFTIVGYLLKTEELLNFVAGFKRKMWKMVRIKEAISDNQ